MCLGPVDIGLQYVTFFPAVAISAVLGGYTAGLTATAIGVLVATFVFTPPYYIISWQVVERAFWSNVVFLSDGMIVTFSIEAMHRFRQHVSRDLQESVADHADLKDKTRYLKTIIDNLFTYAALLDVDGAVLEVNKVPLQRGGLQRSDVVGRHFYDAPWWNYDPVVRAQLIDAMNSARQGYTLRYDVEVRMGQDLVPIDFQIAPVKDENGHLVALIATAVDITKRKRAEQLSRRHKMMIDRAYDGFKIVDMTGHIVEANRAYAALTGYSVDELVGMHVGQLDINETQDQIKDHIKSIVECGHDTFESRFRRKDGTVFNVELTVSYVPEVQHLFVILHDITDRKRAQEERRIAAATFETHEAIMVTDADAKILRVNSAFQRITGYSANEIIGETPRLLKSGRHEPAFYQEMWQRLLREGMWEGEVWDRRKSGQIYPKWSTITAVKNERGETTEYVSIFKDITDRKQAEEEIRNLAFYDALTSLPNRRLLLDRFQVALSMSERNGQYGAVLFLDMDRFKTLNDTLGHESGDEMLVEVAQRIRFSVRDVDTVARLGGDEFVVVFENLGLNGAEASQKVALIAEKIRGSLVVPFHIQGHIHHTSPSMGLCLFQGHRESVETLLKHADTAMYKAKSSGRNAIRFFDPTLQENAEARANLETELRQAVFARQFCLYYQVQFANGPKPSGAEALIRWNHPTRGLVSPLEFIPIAEESSLILEIGNWVLNGACQQLAQWSKTESTRDLVLAVNVSGRQFRATDFVPHVKKLIDEYQINPAQLKLELTESVILDDVNEVVSKMMALKDLGVLLSLDDFGTGYSSLSYLKRLPLDQIKIDRSFVRDVAIDSSDALMVQAIIDMAKNFQLHVIAEGVENQEQLNFLKLNGCTAFQGYLFSEPVPLAEFEDLLLNQVTLH